jgi:diguanylate cyclase (GGDEF)-like protein/PAS domain S-box-containing protein
MENENEQLRQRIKDLEKKNENLIHQSMFTYEAIAIFDTQNICVHVNHQFTSLFGFAKDEAEGKNILDLFAPESRLETLDKINASDFSPFEGLMLRKNGTCFWGFIQNNNIIYNNTPHHITTCRDISNIVALREELNKNNAELESIFNNAAIGIIVLNGDRTIHRVNDTIAKVLCIDDPKTLEGKSIKILHLSDRKYNEFGEKHYESLINQEIIEIEYPFKKQGGGSVWVSLSGSPIDKKKPADLERGIIWVIRDISKEKEAQHRLKQLSRIDDLTQVNNRRYFMELAKRQIKIHYRMKHPICLMMLDIDYFKNVNDSIGHSGGDEALRHFTQICLSEIREIDIMGRLGGEEFSILLMETRLENGIIVAERIRTKIMNTPFYYQGEEVYITVSSGIVQLDTSRPVDYGLIAADKYLYIAKNKGRNQVQHQEI